MLKKVLFLSLVLLASCVRSHKRSPKQLSKRSYDCPSNFIKLGKKCYFVSQERLRWQEAHFKCESMKSQLAVIKTDNQDRLIRKSLNRTEPREYWIGGRYNWRTKTWFWARSNKRITFNGFDPLINYRDILEWSCLVLDPELYYRWDARSCFLENSFICQKSLKTFNKKEKKFKKFDPYNHSRKGLNKVHVLQSSNDVLDQNFQSPNQQNGRLYPAVDINNDLGNDLQNQRSKRKNHRKNKTHKTQNNHLSHSQLSHVGQYSNGTVYERSEPPVERPKEVQQQRTQPPQAKQTLESQNLEAYQRYREIIKRKTSMIT